MNEPTSNPLDALRGIVWPNASVSAWPLAPGWWILLALLILLVFAIWLLHPRFKQYQENRQLLRNTRQSFNALQAEYLGEHRSPASLQCYLQKSNDIFKRVMHIHPQWMAFSSLTGTHWVEWMAKINPHERYPKLYGDTLYAAQCHENIDPQDLHRWNVDTLQHITHPDRVLRKQMKEAAT